MVNIVFIYVLTGSVALVVMVVAVMMYGFMMTFGFFMPVEKNVRYNRNGLIYFI